MKKYYQISFLVFLVTVVIVTLWPTTEATAESTFDATAYNSVISTSTSSKNLYSDVLTNDWKNETVVNMGGAKISMADHFLESSVGVEKVNENLYTGLDFAVSVETGGVLNINIPVDTSGLYRITYNYYDLTNDILPAEAIVLINGELQYYESNQFLFLGEYIPEYEDFVTDRYDNEVPISFVKNNYWMNSGFKDGSKLKTEDLLFYLEKGDNTLSLNLTAGNLMFGDFYLEDEETYDSYDKYISQYPNVEKYDGVITNETEYMYSKTSLSTSVYSDTNPASTRYSVSSKLMNAVSAGSFNSVHQNVTWEVEVPKTGLYNLTFKVLQSSFVDLPVGRNILIDGEIPFAEMKNYEFYYNRKYQNSTLEDENGTAYEFYLTEGTHYITMETSLDTYAAIIEELTKIMEEMRETSLDVKKITGGVTDQYRDWQLTKYMPDLVDDINGWMNRVNYLIEVTDELSEKKGGSGEFYNLEKAITKFEKILKEPDQLPNNMTLFTDGTSSISQLLGDLSSRLYTAPLGVEKMFVHGDEELPSANANIFKQVANNIAIFFLSFTTNEYSSGNVADDELDIWVKRSRQYVELMQRKIDEEFTPQTGIKVKLSVMPDENKLVLANAAGQTPDVAMGISNWIPYELSLRGLSVDFRNFEGYEELIANHTEGAFIPYAFEDGMYGIPETQDFWLGFYRHDILDSINLDYESIETWNDVVDNLPLLQSYGMNYCHPLSTFVGLKAFVGTLPFIYQFGGDLYSEDGLKAQINNEENIAALKFMTDLFSIYSIPDQVASFYNDFRYGTLPMGVSNSGMYTQLLVAAPEIKGNWSIGLHPGMYSETEEEVVHYASTGSQGIMMFNKSEKQQEGFDFIKWWMSTEVQSEYIHELNSTYGPAYTWFSANTEAFMSMPIPQSDKELILEQWDWAIEASRIPGAYMVEREISDAFSKIIFDGENARTVLDEANINANLEITRKMEEFGYIVNGVAVKNYIIPDKFNISGYLKER